MCFATLFWPATSIYATCGEIASDEMMSYKAWRIRNRCKCKFPSENGRLYTTYYKNSENHQGDYIQDTALKVQGTVATSFALG